MGKIGETAVVQLVGDGDGARRTIPVLCQNEVRFTCPRVVTFECVGPMQKDDHVRILLYTARFAKVGNHRPFVGPLFWTAIQLTDCHDRNFQFLGQKLDLPGELTDLLLTRLDLAARRHELQVVEDHELEVVALLEPAP